MQIKSINEIGLHHKPKVFHNSPRSHLGFRLRMEDGTIIFCMPSPMTMGAVYRDVAMTTRQSPALVLEEGKRKLMDLLLESLTMAHGAVMHLETDQHGEHQPRSTGTQLLTLHRAASIAAGSLGDNPMIYVVGSYAFILTRFTPRGT